MPVSPPTQRSPAAWASTGDKDVRLYPDASPRGGVFEGIDIVMKKVEVAEATSRMALLLDTDASGVRQTGCILLSLALARVTFARMSEAFAVQMNGFG